MGIAGRRPRRIQFSLAALLTAVVAAAVLLWLGQIIGAVCTAVAVNAVILALAAATYRHRIRRRFAVGLLLVAGHTLLVAVAAAIDLNVGIDDMSPSLLLFLALYYVDLPIIAALRGFGYERLNLGDDGGYAALTVVGGLFWFIIGALLQWAAVMAMKNLRALPPQEGDD